MAIALVADTTDGLNINGGTTSSINSTGANLLIAMVSYYKGGAAMTTSEISDSKSNTWSQLGSYVASNLYAVRIFYCLTPSVGTGHTFTISQNGTYPSVSFSSWSGVDAYDSKNSGAEVNSTSGQPGSLTPSADGSLLVCHLVNDTDKSYTIDSGFTELTRAAYSVGNSMGGEFAYLIQGTAAAINPTWSWSGAENLAMTMAVWTEAAGGGGSILPILMQQMNW